MRKIALCGALLSLALTCVAAPIKVIDTATRLNTGSTQTNRLKGATAYTNSNAWVDCSAVKELGVMITLQSTQAATTSNVTFYVYKSLTRATYDKAPFQTLTMALTGTTPITLVTNFTVVGYPQLIFREMTNGLASTNYLTNSTVWVFPK